MLLSCFRDLKKQPKVFPLIQGCKTLLQYFWDKRIGQWKINNSPTCVQLPINQKKRMSTSSYILIKPCSMFINLKKGFSNFLNLMAASCVIYNFSLQTEEMTLRVNEQLRSKIIKCLSLNISHSLPCILIPDKYFIELQFPS